MERMGTEPEVPSTDDEDPPPQEYLGTFAVGGPTRDMEAMSQFRHRAVAAGKMGFAAGFPNFYFAHYERDHVGGTILLRPDGVEWRDVPLGDLHDVALTSFADRMRATQLYATDHGFVGGFPNFFNADYDFVDPNQPGVHRRTVCGTILIKHEAAEFRDVPLAELTHHDLDNFEQRFRDTQDYAIAHGYLGGYPNMFNADYDFVDPNQPGVHRRTVCGTILIKQGAGQWADVWMSRDPA